MSEPDPFPDFMRRIRAGDAQAAAELVRLYEPLIRRMIRLKLEDQRLSRLLDSLDVCQSVLASFFLRTAAGQYDLERPEQLVKLLARMARNKLVSAARRQRRQGRDHRRLAADGADELDHLAAADPSPSRLAAGKELLERFRQSLTADERQVADLRGQGCAWTDIAAQLGGTPEARRMQLTRAVERVAQELGLEEDSHE
jgi:RNA polymerase sigma-70 factor (ECF subfamily)